MDTKLTLKLKKHSIERAKKFAKKRNQSLSEIVENYFNFITDKNDENDFVISPNVSDLSGIISLKKDFNLKKSYGKHLEEKYLK